MFFTQIANGAGATFVDTRIDLPGGTKPLCFRYCHLIWIYNCICDKGMTFLHL